MTRTLSLISLIFLVLAGFAFGAIGSDYVSFVWNGGASSADDHGGGAVRTVWDAGSPSDFFNTSTGEAILTVADNSVNITDNSPEYKLTKTGAFANLVTGTIGFVDFFAPDLDGYFVFVKIDDDNAFLSGSTYTSDQTCNLRLGGAIKTLGGTINTDLADAGTVNCDVLIKGNETFPSGDTVASGDGTVTTMLRFLGVDSSWDRIVPTRTTAPGGSKANYLLDTSAMPTITLGANYLLFDVDYVQVDGLYFTGTRTFALAGTATNNQQIYSNCVFDNASTANSAIALSAKNNTVVYNCDIIASGASGTTEAISILNNAHIYNCQILNASSSASSVGIDIGSGEIIGCVFYDIDGTGVRYKSLSTQWVVGHCTFYDVIKPITTPSAVATDYTKIFNNVAEAVGGTEVFIDNLYSGTRKVPLFAAYNHLYNFGTTYNNYVGEQGFQDLASDPLFKDEGNNDYNLQNASPANIPRPLRPGGALDAEAGGGGGGRTPGIGKGIGG